MAEEMTSSAGIYVRVKEDFVIRSNSHSRSASKNSANEVAETLNSTGAGVTDVSTNSEIATTDGASIKVEFPPSALDETATDAPSENGKRKTDAEGGHEQAVKAARVDRRDGKANGSNKQPKLKQRHQDARPTNSKDRLCMSVMRGEERCPYAGPGECQYNHDVRDYLSRKPADIGDRCHIYDTFGFCSSGFMCRFAYAHIHPVTGENMKRPESEGGVIERPQINVLGKLLQKTLRTKGLYDRMLKRGQIGKGKLQETTAVSSTTTTIAATTTTADATRETYTVVPTTTATESETGTEAGVETGNAVVDDAGAASGAAASPLAKSVITENIFQTVTPALRDVPKRVGAATSSSSAISPAVTINEEVGQVESCSETEPITSYESIASTGGGGGGVGGNSCSSSANGIVSGSTGGACGGDPPASIQNAADHTNINNNNNNNNSSSSYDSNNNSYDSNNNGVSAEFSSTAYPSKTVKLIDFSNKVYVAPLTTVGNLPFRRILKDFGADITCGEMAMASNLMQGQASEWALLRRHPQEDCFGVQLAGNAQDLLARTCQMLENETESSFVDLNCGCPIDVVCNRGSGSALMTRPQKLCNILTAMAQNLPSRCITLKIRTGWEDTNPTAHKLAPFLQQQKDLQGRLAAIMVHGRSRLQRYHKLANWEYVLRVAQSMDTHLPSIPIIGNGDILSYHDWASHQQLVRSGLDDADQRASVASCAMLARGALVKPWLPAEIKNSALLDISASDRLEIIKKYCNYGLEQWGSDQQGVNNTRRFLLEWMSFLHRYVPAGLLEHRSDLVKKPVSSSASFSSTESEEVVMDEEGDLLAEKDKRRRDAMHKLGLNHDSSMIDYDTVWAQTMNQRPPAYFGRGDLETLLASPDSADWVRVSEMFLGPVADGFFFSPKHKSNSYAAESNG